jgi:uncharacterized membrane protein
MTSSTRSAWFALCGLLLLSVVPVLAGALRLIELGSDAQITAANARFFASPVPVVLHIVSATIYAVLGAFQFVTPLRRKNLHWHRTAGKLLVPAGFSSALTGLWMTQFYPWPAGDGVALYAVRWIVGLWMLLALTKAVLALHAAKFQAHGCWMLRAYAVGMGAGTQVLTHLPWFALYGQPGETPRAMLMAAGWLINVAVAEWLINRKAAKTARRQARVRTAPATS